MKNCYYRLEGVVISHLQKLQAAVNENSANSTHTHNHTRMKIDANSIAQAHMAVV